MRSVGKRGGNGTMSMTNCVVCSKHYENKNYRYGECCSRICWLEDTNNQLQNELAALREAAIDEKWEYEPSYIDVAEYDGKDVAITFMAPYKSDSAILFPIGEPLDKCFEVKLHDPKLVNKGKKIERPRFVRYVKRWVMVGDQPNKPANWRKLRGASTALDEREGSE